MLPARPSPPGTWWGGWWHAGHARRWDDARDARNARNAASRVVARAGKGVKNLKITDKTGNVVSTINVKDNDKFIVSTIKGITIKTSVRGIRVMGRATSGVRIIKLQHGDRVSDIAKLIKDKEVEEEGE